VTRGWAIGPHSTRPPRKLPRWWVAVVLVLAACTVPSQPATEGAVSPQPPDTGVHFEAPPVEIVTRPSGSWFESACDLPVSYLRRIRRGYSPRRSPDVMVVPREPNFFGGFVATSHSGPWAYLQQVPLVFYGPGFIRPLGEFTPRREVTLADLAPTLARLLGVPWPRGRPGRALGGVLVPQQLRPGPPRVIVTIVWDGGGYNVLNAWPEAWPRLSALMKEGASVVATVGSSPSVTPAVHSTIGTGAWPHQHGIVGIPLRAGGRIHGAFPKKSPKFLRLETLADIYDPTTANAANVGFIAYKAWHLGMLGHGASLPGGDRDIAVIIDQQENFVTGEDYHEVPPYFADVPGLDAAVRTVDLEDGKLDNAWMGHEILDDPRARRDTPVWILHQTQLIKALLGRESFGSDEITDLFFTNYKQIDEAGHNWNLINPEMRESLRYSDRALDDLVEWLDSHVGRRRWVMVVTADHGQGPDAQASGAWPIAMGELTSDLGRRFDVDEGDLIQQTSPVGFWLERSALREARIAVADIAEFLLDYRLEDNVSGDGDVPSQYEPRLREPIFSAAFPSRGLGRIWACGRRQ
jgi:hypothetical protein